MRRLASLGVVAGILAALLPGLPGRAADPPLVRVADDGLRLAFDPATGALRELVHLADGFEHVCADPGSVGPWRLTACRDDDRREVAAEDCAPPRIEPLAGGQGGVRLLWSDVEIGPLGRLEVEVIVRLSSPAAGLSRWELVIRKPPAVRLTAVAFPRLGGIRERPDETLAVPRGLGAVARDPRTLLRRAEGRRCSWTYPRPLSLQCVALYQPDGAGFYAAADDDQGHLKEFVLALDAADRLEFEILHAPEGEAIDEAAYRLPFTGVLGGFRGDWSTAADLYRGSPGAVAVAARAARRRAAAPDWLKDTALWIWNRGRSSDVVAPAIDMQGRLGVPVSILWHWWHGCAYDDGFPEYLPPREGAEALRAALARARDHDVHAILYMNQRLWGTRTPSWSAAGGVERHAVKNPDGGVKTTIPNRFTRTPCAAMCLGTTFWRDTYAGLAATAVRDLGAAGIYMDQAGTLDACHDPGHGHRPGAGRYTCDGLGRLAATIRDRGLPGRPVALAGEHCGEPWLGVLDATLVLGVSAERLGRDEPWEPVPFFTAVYHAGALSFGSYASLVHPPYDEKWPAESRPRAAGALLEPACEPQFMLEQARTFAWGIQPMLANYHPDQFRDRPEALDFLLRLVRTRQRTLKYLRDGVWVRPPAVDPAPREIDLVSAGVYAPARFSKAVRPSLVCGAWRAADGDLAVALAHVGDGERVVEIPLDGPEFAAAAPSAVFVVDHDGRRPLVDLTGGEPAVRCPLPARGVCVVEFVPAQRR